MFGKLLGSAAALIALAGCETVTDTQSESIAAASVPVVEHDGVSLYKRQQAFLAACKDWDEWDKPAPPFQIMGNSWYVGTCGISAILVTGEEGHILLDSGVPEAAELVLANIRTLGFDPADIELILMSHEHYDHVGAHAALSEATGAQVVTSAEAKPVLESGRVAADDPQADADHPPMAPAQVDRVVADGDVVKLGDLELTAHATPGHTPGALSWTWNSCSLPFEPPVCRRIAYVDSLSPVSADSYRFTDHPAVVADFRTSLDTVRFLPCDYLVTPHPSASQMLERLQAGTYGEPGACQRYAAGLSARFDERLAKESAE